MGRDCGPNDRNNCEFDCDCNTHAPATAVTDMVAHNYAPRDCGYNLRTAIRDLAVDSGHGDCS